MTYAEIDQMTPEQVAAEFGWDDVDRASERREEILDKVCSLCGWSLERLALQPLDSVAGVITRVSGHQPDMSHLPIFIRAYCNG